MQTTYTAPGAPAESYPPFSKVWYGLCVLVIVWAFAFLDRQILTMLIEPIRRDVGLSDTQISLVQGAAFSVSTVLAGILAGRLVDSSNRRNIIIVGLLFWSAMTFLCGVAENFWHLFAARVGVGLGEACLAPASMSLIADLVRPNRRGVAMGMVFAGTAVGSAGSIVLGGTMLQALGMQGVHAVPGLGDFASWRIIFFVVGAPGFLATLLMLSTREPPRRETASVDVDLSAFFAFVARQKSAFILTFLAFTMTTVIGYSVPVWTPVILMRIYHVPPGQVGVYLGGLLFVCGIIASPLGGAIGDRLFKRFSFAGRLGPLLLAYPLHAASLSFWLFMDSPNWTLFAFAMSGPILGNLVAGSAYSALSQMVPNEMRGKTLAFYALVTSLVGTGLAPTAVALLTDYAFQDPMMVRYSLIAVCAPAAAIGFLLALACVAPYRVACAETAAEVGAKTSAT